MSFNSIRALLCLLGLATVFLTQAVVAANDDDAAILAAARAYLAANSGISKVTVKVEQVADDFARVKATPEDPTAADAAWIFLKKTDGKWAGIILGTSFTTEDYQQLGVPNVLRIP
jgi:hypothetical protein